MKIFDSRWVRSSRSTTGWDGGRNHVAFPVAIDSNQDSITLGLGDEHRHHPCGRDRDPSASPGLQVATLSLPWDFFFGSFFVSILFF